MPAVHSEPMPALEPEQMIAGLRRKRQLTMMLALLGILVVLGCLFTATGAMYAEDPMRELQTDKAALQPAVGETR